MTKFLIKASYSPDGAKGVLSAGGTSRKQAVERSINNLGGKLQSFHFAFGESDAYLIVEMPDAVSTAALAMNVNASGLASVTTTLLLDPEDIDKAIKIGVDYRGPGK